MCDQLWDQAKLCKAPWWHSQTLVPTTGSIQITWPHQCSITCSIWPMDGVFACYLLMKLGLLFVCRHGLNCPCWCCRKSSPLYPSRSWAGAWEIFYPYLQSNPIGDCPFPQDATLVSCNKTWLPIVQKFLPYSWVDATFVTNQAIKRYDTGVPAHLWDKRVGNQQPRKVKDTRVHTYIKRHWVHILLF